MTRPLARAALTLCGLALGACSSPPRPPEPIDAGLPFHVLLVGLEEANVRPNSLPEDAAATSMQVAVDADQVATALSAELEKEAFVRITRAPAGLDPLTLARAERADLILDCRLEYEPGVWRRRHVSSAVSWLLFALGGPFVTNLRDWEYGIDAELSAGLYDVARLDGGLVRMGDARARVTNVEAEFGALALNFNERRKGHSSFWRALLIPSHLLAKENPSLEKSLADQLAPRLSNALARRLAERQSAILAASPGGFLSCDPNSFQLKSRGPNLWTLSGRLELRQNPRFAAPNELRLLVGERLFTAAAGNPEPTAGGQSFPFELSFESEGQRFVRLEVEAGSRDRELRSYCLDLERGGRLAPEGAAQRKGSAP